MQAALKKSITFYFDFVSPYAYLAFETLPRVVQHTEYSIIYKPIFFGAILKKYGHLGPAEIPSKREWVYRHVTWLARQQGLVLDMPAVHPFSPLPHLRLALACDLTMKGTPDRSVCETIFHHVWQGGEDPQDLTQLVSLMRKLHCASSAHTTPAIKDRLKTNTNDAVARGVFGVPTFEVEGHLFWGVDSIPMLQQYLARDCWFTERRWHSVEKVKFGRLGGSALP